MKAPAASPTTFQPSPWWVHPDDRPGMSYNREIVFGNGDNRICFMAHSAGRNPRRDKANAYLIAAAPDLFEALTNLAAAFVNPGDGGEFEDGEVPVLDRARTALAKARGEG